MRIRRRARVFTYKRGALAAAALLLACWGLWPSSPAAGAARTKGPEMARRSLSDGGHVARPQVVPDPEAARRAAAAALAKWVELTDVKAAASSGESAAAGDAPVGEAEGSHAGAGLPDEGTALPGRGGEAHFQPGDLEQQMAEEPLEGMRPSDAALEDGRSSQSGGSGGPGTATATKDASSMVATDHGTSNAAVAASGSAQRPMALVDPGLRCPPLSRELLQRHAKRNTIMLGVMNSVQQDFGQNWIWHLQDSGVDYFVVAAADRKVSTLLANMKVPCFESAAAPDPSLPFQWGQEGWRRMTWQKVLIVDQVIEWGFDLVVSDMDVVWMRDPLPLFEQHPHADVLFSVDGCATANTVGDEGLELHGHMHHNFNTGVYLLRSTPSSIKWVHAWRAMFDSGFAGHDQEAAYQLTRRGDVTPHLENPRVTTAWGKSLYVGILPTHLLSNAHTYMVQRLHEKMGARPYDVHAVWTYNGIGGKRARLRDAMLWYDDPAYYSERSFVTVSLRVPRAPEGFNDFQENEDMISFHLAAIQGQLSQAYFAMALATAAGRAFISPKFQCFCEKIWYAVVHCRVVDAQSLQFPINCPTDYLFQPDNFRDDPSKFGTPLDFREPSFLDNPRTPAAVKASVLVIKPSTSLGCTDCVKERKLRNGGLQLLVPIDLKDRQLLELLRPYEEYRVWRLSFRGVKAPGQVFAGFTCAGAAREFDKRMEHITTDWCCRREEEAKKYGLQDRIREQLRMTTSPFSAQQGLDTSC